MIPREISPFLTRRFQQYQNIYVTGPRGSGKTTLCRGVFDELSYANLESPQQRDFADADPVGFLRQIGCPAILDEVQRVPELLSHLERIGDERRENGLFVLIGSRQTDFSSALGQSLVGRVSNLRLLPLSLSELDREGLKKSLDEILFTGLYPQMCDQSLNANEIYDDYFATLVERDVTLSGGVDDLRLFESFIRLCASNIGRILNLSNIGDSIGISHTTAKRWLSQLEQHYIAYELRPYSTAVGKRLVKSPKLYFYDVGLASYLLGIKSSEQVATHPLRSALFENLVISEILKHGFNRGSNSDLSFYRDSNGVECDVVFETARGTVLVEIKSGETITREFFNSLDRVADSIPHVMSKAVVYAGSDRQVRSSADVMPYSIINEFLAAVSETTKVENTS